MKARWPDLNDSEKLAINTKRARKYTFTCHDLNPRVSVNESLQNIVAMPSRDSHLEAFSAYPTRVASQHHLIKWLYVPEARVTSSSRTTVTYYRNDRL